MVGRPPDPKLRKAREEAVMQAAMQLFAEKGVRQTTMKDICTRADISPGALYRYFASKEDIILAIADLDARDVDQLIAAIEEGPDLVTTLQAWSDKLIAWQTDELSARLRIEFAAESLRNPEVGAAFQGADDQLRLALEAAIERGLERGRIVSGFEAGTLAFLLQSLMDGIAARAALTDTTDQSALSAELHRLFSLLRV
ncbi:TetR/AcrR family transcriptional regulator [Pseudovibrio exalbescens]|uniref:TetR/AcrR family transcriptional regulator n=1 Tax=Pseudovibrio exalbescens TaxID=197461 RepID=UPI0015E06886|nr:TetR/AcrR family transcriptional regulator [Pseudovibrio exalbescens]